MPSKSWTSFAVNDPLQTTLADAAELLRRNAIPYALVGGMAASLRGQPRATADVDLIIGADLAVTLALAATLDSTAFRPLFSDIASVIERSFILPLRHRRTNVRIDLALGLSGFEQQAISRAKPIDIGGYSILVVTAEDLLIMKVLAGRPQDEQDARSIVTAQGKNLDWGYCQTVAKDLGDALGQDLVRSLNAFRNDQPID
jgi:hypothetical protein